VDKQSLRNALTAIEDEARSRRGENSQQESIRLLTMIANLAQLVREEIVK